MKMAVLKFVKGGGIPNSVLASPDGRSGNRTLGSPYGLSCDDQQGPAILKMAALADDPCKAHR